MFAFEIYTRAHGEIIDFDLVYQMFAMQNDIRSIPGISFIQRFSLEKASNRFKTSSILTIPAVVSTTDRMLYVFITIHKEASFPRMKVPFSLKSRSYVLGP